MTKQIIYLLLFCCINSFCFAQSAKDITAISLQYDHEAILEEFNQVNIGFEIQFMNGKIRKTTGWLNGNYGWNNFSVHTSQGNFKDGVITFDRWLVMQNNDCITVAVQVPGRNDLKQSFTIQVPKFAAIHFNLYSDSLKRDIEYDLNVQGIFNNGKSYPLDTTSIIYKASAGRLISNNLWLSLQDTAVHFIKVKAIYKLNPALADSVIIPVKRLTDNAPLPSEESILRKYKKKKK